MPRTKKKTYMLDTNILLVSPYALYAFDEHDVCITDATLEELDKHKTDPGETGVNAREAIRQLDAFRNRGDLIKGVRIREGGGMFRVEINHVNTVLPASWDVNKGDNRILRVCKALKEEKKSVILVSNDINMRVKAALLEVPAEEFRTDRSASIDEQYKGRDEIVCKAGAIDKFYRSHSLTVNDLLLKQDLYINQFLLLSDEAKPNQTALAKFDGKKIVPLLYGNGYAPWGLTPKNVGQKFAIEALMAPPDEIPLVILKGSAGCGKTILALAAGLEQTLGEDSAIYKKILVVRPNVKMDEDIGYLKGTEREKIDPLIRPIYDNLETLINIKNKGKKDEEESANYSDYLFDRGYIDAQALAYMRGRSVTNTWLILDEMQNASPTQAFSIVSRAGANTKAILCGDPEQIDNPRLDSRTNGLSFTAERMKGSPLCAQVTLSASESVRSPLAVEAINRMSPKGYQGNK